LPRTEVLKSTDIIRSATLIGTEYIRREGALGVIVPGTIADLLVVDGNPITRIEDLRKIADVYQDGNLVNRGDFV